MLADWKKILEQELVYKSFRSGGKGGQNVNKVETAIQLNWMLGETSAFADRQKIILAEKLSDRMNKEGWVQIKSQKHRTQLMNKEEALEKLHFLIEKALVKKRIRIATKVPKSVVEKRINDKKLNSDKKANRRKDWDY